MEIESLGGFMKKFSGLFLLVASLFLLASCATTTDRSKAYPEFQQAQEGMPYFKTFNSNWIRHSS